MLIAAQRDLTVKEALNWATSSLLKGGVAKGKAYHEAELLLAEILSLSRTELYLNFNEPLSITQKEDYCRQVEKRLKGAPLQYILGHQFFRYLKLKVEPGVFIPRPETELLVEEVIRFLDRCPPAIARHWRACPPLPTCPPLASPTGVGRRAASGVGRRAGKEERKRKVLDLGVGSGAIALSLAYEVSSLKVYALDFSPLALKIAQENAKRYGLEKKVRFIKSNLFERLGKDLKEEFRVIVSNPPYVSDSEFKELEKEVCDFEPYEALLGGRDGLDIYREVAKEAPYYLKSKGLLGLEVGLGQAPLVSKLLQKRKSFEKIIICQDYAGIDRFVLAIKN